MNEKLGAVDQQLLKKTTNRKQENTAYVLLLVESCDIKLEILNKLTHLTQSETHNCDVRVIFCEGFSLVPAIITTIINCRQRTSIPTAEKSFCQVHGNGSPTPSQL